MVRETVVRTEAQVVDTGTPSRRRSEFPASGKAPTRVSVTQTTVAALQRLIRDGTLKVGMSMPPERELAGELQVSRATLREALSLLATMGVVAIKPGRGTFVCEPPRELTQFANATSWRFTASYSPAEIYQFRYIAESYAAQLAAMRLTEELLDEIRQNLEDFRRATRDADFDALIRVDFAFHELLINISANRILADMNRALVNVVMDSQRLPLTRRAKLWDAFVEHERIVEALSMNDPAGVGYYMRQHISRTASRAGIVIAELV